MPIGFFF